jgi:geranylgeranyl diphosphate synthase type I
MIAARRAAALTTLEEADLPRAVTETLRQIVWMATERQS